MEAELGGLDAVLRRALIDLDAEVARVQELLLELEVQALEDVHADGSRGVQVPALEELEALFVRLAEQRVLRVRNREPAARFRQEGDVSRCARARPLSRTRLITLTKMGFAPLLSW